MTSILGAARLAVAALLAACRNGDDGRAERTRALDACVVAIDRADDEPPSHRLITLARGCAAACPGLPAWADAVAEARRDHPAASGRQRWLDDEPAVSSPVDAATAALLDGCAIACTPAARDAVLTASAPARWSTLAQRCGPRHLGLDDDHAALASETWVILHRINAWLEDVRRRPVSDPQVPAQLERATMHARFPLELPAADASAGYLLPPSSRGVAVDRALYVVVAGASVRIGGVPAARLRGPDLERLAPPGGEFPGSMVADDQLARAFAEQVALLAADDAPPPEPLLLVDAAVPIARLVTVVSGLGVDRAWLAVAGAGARAHPVALERMTSEAAAAPTLTIAPGHITIGGFDDDRQATPATLVEELRHFAAVNAPVRRVALDPRDGTSVADLAAVLDACDAAHIASALFMPSGGLSPAGSPPVPAPPPVPPW